MDETGTHSRVPSNNRRLGQQEVTMSTLNSSVVFRGGEGENIDTSDQACNRGGPMKGWVRGGPMIFGECVEGSQRPGSLSCTPENGTGWDQRTELSGHRPMPRSRVVSEVPLCGWSSPQAALENPLQSFTKISKS